MDKRIHLFVVDDEPRFRELLLKALPEERFNVQVFGTAAELLKNTGGAEFDVGIIDLRLPDMDGIALLKELKKHDPLTEYIILTGQACVETAIAAMKLGCYDYLTKPLRMDELEMVITKAYEKRLISRENLVLKKELQLGEKYHELVGKSEQMRRIFTLIEKVAQTTSPVLVTGESGTGKELAARAIHRSSPRKDQAFIVIDCASLSENLLENELFGHEEGAFTDAGKMKRGLLEIADGGTLFIDEIGEMKLSTQSKLLRVTETRQFRRLGGNKQIEVDVRIVAATNRNLVDEVANGTFRKDLYYRLNVFPLQLPPLRERKEDIQLLAEYFIAKRRQTVTKKIDTAAMGALIGYSWPGNVRELANVIERALIIAAGDRITTADLPVEFMKGMAMSNGTVENSDGSLDELVRQYERAVILKTLRECGDSRVEAARLLRLSRSKLYRKIEQLGIPLRGRAGSADASTTR